MKTKNLFLLPVLIAGLSLIPAGRVTAQTFTTLHSFAANSGYPYFTNSDGAGPYAGLFLSGNILYGTAQDGGLGSGTVFAVNTDGTGFTTLHSFTIVSPREYPTGTNSDGAKPQGGLILSGNTLYGTAGYGGSSGAGTVFKVNTDGTGFTILYSFTKLFATSGSYPYTNSDGASPVGGLILSGNILYGAAVNGGSSGAGTVFAVNTDGTRFTNLHSLTALVQPYFTNSDGINPQGGLILSGNTLYGTATQAGSEGNGTVFRLRTDGTGFTTLHNFAALHGSAVYPTDGFLPYGRLILSGDTLYGTALGGGNLGHGTVFAINTNGTGFRILHNAEYPSDGANPYAGLFLSGKTLYGTTLGGGSSDNGTVFKLCTDGTGFTTLHDFVGSPNEGTSPFAGLILSGKTLYGTTVGGGSSGLGTVFKLSLNHAPSSVANVAPLFAISPTETNGFILSPNNATAAVVLDGSQSSDPDDDPLEFLWSADGQPNALATGAVATHRFAVGPHTVQLVLSDGYDTATAQVSFEVITPATAAGQLILWVDEANVGGRNKQPLLTTLSAAMSSFDRGDVTAALNQLSAFQHKARAQLGPSNPSLATELTAASRQIITVVCGR